MINNPDRSAEIAQLLIKPEPSLPNLSGVNFKDKVQRNEWFPLQFQFQELTSQALDRVILALRSEIDDFGIKPDVIIGTKPRGSDIPALLAKDLETSHVFFDVEGKRFEDSNPLIRFSSGVAVIVEDFLTTGGRALDIKELLEGYKIQTPLYISVVSYENAYGIDRLEKADIEPRTLTSAEEIMRNEDFLNRGNNRTIANRRIRYLQSHSL